MGVKQSAETNIRCRFSLYELTDIILLRKLLKISGYFEKVWLISKNAEGGQVFVQMCGPMVPWTMGPRAAARAQGRLPFRRGLIGKIRQKSGKIWPKSSENLSNI